MNIIKAADRSGRPRPGSRPASVPRAESEAPEPDIVREATDLMDRTVGAAVARATLGLSPAVLAGAYLDWLTHLAGSPGRQQWLAWKGWRKALRYVDFLALCAAGGGRAAPCIDPLPGDRRFAAPAWQAWPFNAYYQGFLLWQQWVHNATTDLRGVSAAHERVVSFVARQLLDTVAPSNFPLTNPVVLERARQEAGANFVRGLAHLAADIAEAARGAHGGRPNPAVGRTVAVTPGKVVFRNRLIELIQYAPATGEVAVEPLVIVPAWIMKYYILDLSEHDSLVRYMVAQGFTVFMISWRNPGAEDRDLSMDDYLSLGVMAAIDAACAITGEAAVHAVGYCLGGTLLSIAAAAMARDGDLRLRSVSLFAAQQDFTEAGELTLFVNPAEIALLDDMMHEQGYLDARQMAGAFQILRSNDLVWSHVVQSYLLGEKETKSDLMAWNADTTRMPARMHGEYLRGLFLDNDLAEGRWQAGGKPVAISDVHAPIFAVGTETDHVAPWRSVYKITLLTDAEVTFVLTAGGHNAGIVSEPGHPRRHFLELSRPQDGRYVPPDLFLKRARRTEGSWWPAWARWLRERSDGTMPPPPLGRPAAGYTPICDAPGAYVFQR
ncbi:MAG: polyhydroxyalkanoic acid synthase [Proteobacteria bacterium]|nr:polyhydroxyalkanoic acid synthase [Pseudomonadota bacterium]